MQLLLQLYSIRVKQQVVLLTPCSGLRFQPELWLLSVKFLPWTVVSMEILIKENLQRALNRVRSQTEHKHVSKYTSGHQ